MQISEEKFNTIYWCFSFKLHVFSVLSTRYFPPTQNIRNCIWISHHSIIICWKHCSSSSNYLGNFIKQFVCVIFLDSISYSIYIPILRSVPHCLEYGSFPLELWNQANEILQHWTSFQNCLTILSLLHFHITSRNLLSISVRLTSGIFIGIAFSL